MKKLLAVKEIPLPPIKGPGPFGGIDFTKESAVTNFMKIVANIYRVIMIVAGLWFFVQLVIAGFSWLTSGGDPKSLEGARNRISHAFIGLIIVLFAWGVGMLVEKMSGVCFGFSCVALPEPTP